MNARTSELLARLLTRLTEQDSQRVQQYAAQVSAAAAIAPNPKSQKMLAKMADYWGHEGDALSHKERILKAKRKKRKTASK